MDFLTDPNIWASFATLVVLEIVLGVDNVIFISIVSNRLPAEMRAKARKYGLTAALLMRIALLGSIAWIVTLTQPFMTIFGFELSWRDVILISGGAFLIYKAANEIYDDIEGPDDDEAEAAQAMGKVVGVTFQGAIVQIMLLDLVFSLDSVITAVGLADELIVMIAAVIIAIYVMWKAAGPISDFVHKHPSTKMLALAFLVMIGTALIADGFHYHIERGFIYAAMVFAGGVEVLNVLRGKRRKRGRRDGGAGVPEATGGE
jgi:predicted tellurium resistance membrane protein TerC